MRKGERGNSDVLPSDVHFLIIFDLIKTQHTAEPNDTRGAAESYTEPVSTRRGEVDEVDVSRHKRSSRVSQDENKGKHDTCIGGITLSPSKATTPSIFAI